MSLTGTTTAEAADLAGLARARGLPEGQVSVHAVNGAGECPVVLSVDKGTTGPAATRGAVELEGGWVLAGAEGALLQTLDACVRPDSNPSQIAAIVSAMAAETPITPILENADGMTRDALAAAGRGYVPPESTTRDGAVALTFQALLGGAATLGEVTLNWHPGQTATVEVTRY